MDHTQVGLITLGATQGIAIFTSLMPDRAKLYDMPNTSDVRQNVRQGELVASTLTIGFATLLAFIVKDKTPLLIAGATVIAMIGAYEYTLCIQPLGS